MLPIAALAVFAAWTCISVFVLSLCVVAGRADRAMEAIMGSDVAAPQPEPGFVFGFAEPQGQAAPLPLPTRTRV
jgi:hypothetical protein